MNPLHRTLPVISLTICLIAFADCVYAAERVSKSGAIPTLYVIGDSTAARYPEERYPLYGWAQVLQDHFDPARLAVEDRARSGRSSKSFYDEGAWAPIREALRPGDWVFIQFGHNDEKKDDPSRSTDPATTFPDHLRRYVEETRAAGANPVLLTPIIRNQWNASGQLENSHGDFPDATRRVAREMNVPLIDMLSLTQKHLTRLGPEKSSKRFMNLAPGEYPGYPDGKTDNTHLQESGAREFCALAIKGLRHVPLRRCLKTRPLPRYSNGFTKSARVLQTSSR